MGHLFNKPVSRVGAYSRGALNRSITVMLYRKIPNISPGLIEVRKHFLEGLYSGGPYIRRAFCASV